MVIVCGMYFKQEHENLYIVLVQSESKSRRYKKSHRNVVICFFLSEKAEITGEVLRRLFHQNP